MLNGRTKNRNRGMEYAAWRKLRRVFTLGSAALALMCGWPAQARQRLETRFVADRVLVAQRLVGGTRLWFYTDSGGGGSLLYPPTVARLALRTSPVTGPAAQELPASFRQLTDPLRFVTDPSPPQPILVAPDFIAAMGGPAEADGFLGNTWFAGRIWTWDYVAHSLTLEDNGWQPGPKDAVTTLGFRPSAAGQHVPAFPRIVVSLAGEPTSMLLDTGAETLLTHEALKRLGGGPAPRATSMIVTSRFDAWHAAHPDWPVIDRAQVKTGARMIRVPDVSIAGIQVGPIWFTERPDAAFHGMMSAAMDARVEGALGGNAFRNLRMTVDYRGGRAAFHRR